METWPSTRRPKKSPERPKNVPMAEKKGRTIKKTFALSEVDLAIIKAAVNKCGYFSDSEALRAMIKHFADNAPCLKAQLTEASKGNIRDFLLKGR